jgi:GTP cyclohydrolase I
MKKQLPDIQASQSKIEKHIKKVGVRNITVPIFIKGKSGRKINTVADVSIYTSLTPQARGSHMSRYVEILNDVIQKEVSLDILTSLLSRLKKTLGSKDSYVKFAFTYFKKKKAPITRKVGYVPYPVIFEGVQNRYKRLYLTVTVPYTSLCPCSKEISQYSAHNQKSTAIVKVELKSFVKIEDIIEVVEKIASCELYSVLKREDEKCVTERAYENPKFVEDVARELSAKLDTWLDKSISDYYVVIEHYESIHPHSACAVVTAGRKME